MRRGPLAPLAKIVEENPERIVVRNKLQKWAVRNSYSLTFLSAMFIITWILMAVFKWLV